MLTFKLINHCFGEVNNYLIMVIVYTDLASGSTVLKYTKML